jgi:hypothetical protein
MSMPSTASRRPSASVTGASALTKLPHSSCTTPEKSDWPDSTTRRSSSEGPSYTSPGAE